MAGGDLFIVDNSDSDWKVRQYLQEWSAISSKIDIATGYFEIGALLALDGHWQKLDALRVLMGDEVSRRTKTAMLAGVSAALDHLNASIEQEKKTNDFLTGIDAVVEALSSSKIRCRVYNKEKFHAKAYINHARSAVIGSAALVGSSNFTFPGLTNNVELNVQIKGREVELLQEWYEKYWDKALDITPEVLRIVERHTRDYSPFEVYAKALHEYFRGRQLDSNEWERATDDRGSRLYRKLDTYQQDGYHNLLKIADQFGGAFLCDGVGLGKTFVGLMLLEKLIIHERKNVLLLVPKAGIDSVWMPAIRRYLPHISGKFANLAVLSHTDLTLDKCREDVQSVKERAHVIIIDEAHHFRNPGRQGRGADLVGSANLSLPAPGQIEGREDVAPSRYRVLSDIAVGKKLFLLTATPVNNELSDLRHMIELFTQRKEDFFKETLGINSLRTHFTQLEKRLEKHLGLKASDGDAQTDAQEAKEILAHDTLFKRLVVQRSRSYVRKSQLIAGTPLTMFPKREPPKVQKYSVKKTYGKLLDLVEKAFDKKKPLFSLAIYYPLAYYSGPDAEIDKFAENRQKQIVGLIRTGFLKRFESSVVAFERSCERLLVKFLAWVTVHAEGAQKRSLETWMRREADIIGYVTEHQHELWGDDDADESDDLINEELLESIEELPRTLYDVDSIVSETMQDLDTLVDFLQELRKFKPSDDGKILALRKLLTTDPVLKSHKVLIFTEFADTARYIKSQLEEAKIDGLAAVDGATSGKQRAAIIRRFAPYYNGTTPAELAKNNTPEIRVLISTDVLSEGLNLQDATRLINFDLHWNPVRLMQRIGRVDRRMNPDTEALIAKEHPDRAAIRGTVLFWNFLPPEELNILLTLYSRVTHKTLRISKTLGIEGKKLLTEDDDYEDLREFNEGYEGSAAQSPLESLRLEYEQLLAADKDLADRLADLPGRVFSGKEHAKGHKPGVFFCYALPGRAIAATPGLGTGLWSIANDSVAADNWTLDAGEVRWYFVPADGSAIAEDIVEIAPAVRSKPETPRRCEASRNDLSETRKSVEKHITNTYFKQRQAPVGVKPVLMCWMEVN
jgi:superfamily II DNA or RNA helicase